MADVKTYTLNLENKGLMIARPGDVLPDGYLSSSLNLTSNKSGFIQSRGGSTRPNATNLGSSVHSQGRIIVSVGNAFRFQGASTSLYREWASIASGLSGNLLTFKEGGPDLSILPQMIVFDSNARYKDNGTLTTGFGIAGPMAAASAVQAAATTKTIDLFEYSTNGAIAAAWVTVSGTITTSTTNPFQGTYCGNIAVAASTTCTSTLTSALNLNQFAAVGDSDNSDWICPVFRCDHPEHVAEVRLLFDIGDGSFTQNYYWKSFEANILSAAAAQNATAATATQNLNSDIGVRLAGTDNQDPRFTQAPPIELAIGDSQWLQAFVPKSDFIRVGTSLNSWANVNAVQLVITTNGQGAINLGVDDFIMQGSTTARLNATDYTWIYRYEDENTGTVSPFSPNMVPALNTDGVTITAGKAAVTVRNPRDTQATHIQLYRDGGAQTVPSLAIRQAVTTWTGTTTITDGVADQNLGDVADLTQVEMANILQTPSQTCTSFGKTTNAGSSYTDYTAAVSDDNAGTFANLNALDTVANNNWVVIGADAQFREILIAMDANVNTNASVLTVQYWDGAVWRAVVNQSDGTAVGGKTLAKGGTIKFEFPVNWQTATANSISAYYIRFSLSAALSATVHIAEVRLSANAFDPTTCESHNGRIWTDDSQHNDRAWYSNRFAIENFADTNFLVVATGADPLVRPFGLDDQLFMFTVKTVNRVIGSTSQTFDTVPTGSEEGLFAKYAICRGRSRIFYRAYSGIYALAASGYAQKISMPIDGIFHGFPSEDGFIQPIDQTKAATETMEFFDAKIWYNYTDTNGVRQEIRYDLELDRWEPTDRPSTSYLRLDDLAQFYSGSTDGYVYQRETGNQDQGANIAIRFRTQYIDFGSPTVSKQITSIQIDGDTAGGSLAFFATGDNGSGFSQTSNLSSSGRGIMNLNLADDSFCRNLAIRLDSNNGGALCKFYKITVYYIVLAAPVTKFVTDWDDNGFPGDKRLRQLQVEMDTAGTPATILVQSADTGVSTTLQTLTFPAGARQIVPFSMNADIIAKLTRLNITSTTGFRYYTHQFEFLKDPLQMTRYNTIELDFGYTRWKYIRRVWLAANTPALVTMQIYVDQVLRYTLSGISLVSSSGWTKLQIKLPPGLKGMLYRFVFTSAGNFKIFLDQSDVEWRPLAEERGYQRAPMARSTA